MFLDCPTCHLAFVSQFALQEHLRSHMKTESDPADNSCQICGKVFAKKDHLKRHEATHSNVRAHKCQFCQSTFKRKDKLTAHLNNQHSLPIAPPQPKRKIIMARPVVKQEMVHVPSPGRDFVCSFCFMSFTRKYHLDRHTSASHSGVKAHQCHDCGRRFTRKDHMERHQMTHLGVKPYGCTICDKSFTRKERLAEHFASHESALMGQLPFPCAYCDRRFASTKSRANHMQQHADSDGASHCLEVKMDES